MTETSVVVKALWSVSSALSKVGEKHSNSTKIKYSRKSNLTALKQEAKSTSCLVDPTFTIKFARLNITN